MSFQSGSTTQSSTSSNRSQWIGFVVGVLLSLLAVVWWFSSPTTPASLEYGLRLVEELDSDGVTRVERELQRLGRDDEASVLQGAWLVKRGRHEEALKKLPTKLSEGAFRKKVLSLVGESLFQVGALGQAEEVLNTLIREEPDNVDAHRLLAALYYDLGAPGKALKSLERVFELAPGDYRPHHLAAIILKDNENFQSAAAQVRAGLEKSPPEETRRELHEMLIQVLIRLGEFQSGLDATSEAETTPELLTRRAECYWSLGQRDEAGKLNDLVLTRDSQSADALKLKARMVEDEGRAEEALKLLDRALAVAPYDLEARYHLVQVLAAQRDEERRVREQAEYDRYRSLQDRMVKLNQDADENPDAVEPRRELANVCQQLGRFKLAAMWKRTADMCESRMKSKTSGPVAPAAKDDEKSPAE